MRAAQLHNRIVPLASGLLASVPVLVDLAVSERARKFTFLASDAFYYLTVARHISRLGFISFDQEYTTNGFHPVWQVLMACAHWLMDRTPAKEDGLMTLSLVMGALLTGLGIYYIGRAAQLERNRLSVWFAGVPFGILSLVFLPLTAGWTSVWSAANGMETTWLPLLGFQSSRPKAQP